jgi:mannose-6-phosphate isomerase-like protein (cupin superfamily)
MPISKFFEFKQNMTGPNILLTASQRGSTIDGISEMSIHYVEMQPGEEVHPHTHARTEVYIFLTGRARVMTGTDIEDVTTGDVAMAPAGMPHAIKVVGSEPLRFYALNAPPASSSPMQEAPEDVLWKWVHRR